MSNQKHQRNKEHHWVGLRPLPDEYFGFVYCIYNKTSGKRYIGKKQYYLSSGKAKNRITDRQSPKWNPTHWRESDWKTYTGSSKDLNKEIKKEGIDNYVFEILIHCQSKGDLHYSEIELQVELDVLRAKDENGEYLYHNKQIAAVKFRPPENHSKETRQKIKERLAEKGHPMEGKPHPSRGKKLPQCAPKNPKSKGSKHITNGTENRWLVRGEELPEGWRYGITRFDVGREPTEKELKAKLKASKRSVEASHQRLATKAGFVCYEDVVNYVLDQYKAGITRQVIAKSLNIGWSTVDRIIKRSQQDGKDS